MKKILFLLVFVFCFVCYAWAATTHYHIFFICEKKIANIGGVDYDYYEVTSGGQTYYMMEYGWPHPSGYTVYRATLLANSGSNYLLHFYTQDGTKANIAGSADQYAGGGSSRFRHVALAAAHSTMEKMSNHQVGAHAAFPVGAVVRLITPCRWKVAGEWVSGTYGDWITAGTPADDFHCNPVMAGFE